MKSTTLHEKAALLGDVFSLKNPYLFSSTLVVFSLFGAGVGRSCVSNRYCIRNCIKSGIEMLIVGGIAAVIVYGVGYFVRGLVG